MDSETIEILHPGMENTDSGPDFFNAKIRIDNTIWAGNVEIHIRSSDWFRHGHHTNGAYNNVILHAVAANDKAVVNAEGKSIPVVELKYAPQLLENYCKLMNYPSWLACENDINKIEPFQIDYWFGKLVIERLETKAQTILEKLEANKNNFEETFYEQLARSFGFNLNGDPFEMLAKSLPLNYIAKHKNNLHQLEAFLFGQAGMLENDAIKDEYYIELKREYDFLKIKFDIKPIPSNLWKHLRLRPTNFPEIRIAQFAKLIYQSSRLFSKIIEADTIEKLRELFSVEISDYWLTHYTFGKESPKRTKQFGQNAFHTIVINTVIPFLFVYGMKKDEELYKTRALQLLEDLPAEINNVVKTWEKQGVKLSTAAYSQAVVQLKKHYCDADRCLDCQIGCKLISLYHNEAN